jgi:hypothetical protein
VGSILAQEVGWFDAQGRGALATRVSELTSKVTLVELGVSRGSAVLTVTLHCASRF